MKGKETDKKTQPVRLEKDVVGRVRKYVEKTRQTISGFISSEIEKVLDKIEGGKNGK